jgi:predicted nucleic acid-binding protein
MPEHKTIVINTGPILALVSALGDLNVLKVLYDKVIIPLEVCNEIMQGGKTGFAVQEFEQATWLLKQQHKTNIPPFLASSLDIGEASVIETALQNNISTVCIDEAVGRRIARLHQLKLTGSIGILIKAKNSGYQFDMKKSIDKMKVQGIWLSDNVIKFALEQTKLANKSVKK